MINQIDKIIHRWDLLRYLVISELKVAYRNKFLGIIWSLLDPLLMMGVYFILIDVIFRRGESNFLVLLLTAILAWQWFSQSISSATVSIAGASGLVRTIKFPLIILPLKGIASGLVDFLIGLIVLVPLLFFFNINLTLNILWLPILILIQLIFTIGLASICATLGVYFRDLSNIIVYGLRIWFYLTPVLYSMEARIPEKFHNIYLALNPLAALINSYKAIIIEGKELNSFVLLVAIFSILMLWIGLTLFDKKEDNFSKLL